MIWFADNPEWLCTVIVIASCIAINSTLPLWLRLAKICDDRKNPGKEGSLEDSGVESESESDEDDNNTKGSNRKHANSPENDSSVVSDAQNSIAASTIGSQLGAVLEARPRKAGRADRSKRRKRERDIRFAAVIQKIEIALPTNGSLSGARSVMSKLSVDDVVSIKDVVNEKEGGETKFHGTDAPYERRSCWQVVMEVTEWDSSLASLAGFYMVQDVAEKVFSIVELAVISHMIGTTEANAYIMVIFFFELSGILVIGFEEAIGILVPQADGSANDLLVGRYLQIGIIFTIIFHIPGFLIWSYYVYDAIIWFGFDERTATIAQNYTYSMFLSILADAVDNCLITFLDVTDRELYVTVYSVIGEFISAGVLVAMALYGVSNMVLIGVAQTLVSLTLLLVNIIIVVNNGWLDDYSEGLVKSFGLKDYRAMRTTFVTAAPLAIAWLLSIGEWQLMLIFAQSIGPDEVAAWNMLGYIWELFEPLTEAISAAAEVRVGFRMGAGKPQEARKMSEKSVFLGAQFAIITAGGLFVIAEYLLPWITPNLTYQELIFDQIPLIGFGGILMVPGLIIEGIFCAQGRVRLMTIIEIIVSWFIAIPIAAILVYYFNFSLDGIVAGLVIGYSTGATVLLFFFLRSNWEELSAMVMKQNATEALQYLDTEWDELPHEVQNAASTLGYTQIMWESNREPDTADKSWNDLTAAEQTAAGVLGYNKKKWNGESNSTEDGANYEEFDFDDLPQDVKEAAKFLGFTRSIWEKDGMIPLESKDWAYLTAKQQNAAGTLGYTKDKWDNESDSDSSSSYSSSDKAMSTTPKEKEEAASAISKEKEIEVILEELPQEATSAISKEKEVDYDDCDFEELPPEVKKAAKSLGYTSSIWDYDGKVPIENKDWEDLTAEEQTAARTLGYNREKWDYGSDSSSSSSDNLEPLQKTEKVGMNTEKNACGVLDGIVEPLAGTSASICCSKDIPELLDKPPLSKSRITESDITTSLYQRQSMVGMTGNGNGKRKSSKHSVTKYGEHCFDELPNDIQQAALMIGFTRSTWDRNLYIPRKNKTWDSLTPDEKDAALSLGCTEGKWEKRLDR